MEKKKSVSIVACLFSLTNVMAQSTDSTRQINLNEVNVVASKLEKNNFETPRSVSVITSGQIKQAGYASIADVLNDAAGIYIIGAGQNPGANESIFMRGANSNQTVILVDGVRMSDASTVNNTIDLSELSIAEVDRIEIIRGSHSTLYGSAAVGGVISITTNHGTQKGFHGNASATVGTFGKKTFDRRGNGSLGYTFENGIYVDAGIEKILVDGLDATMDTVTDPNVFKHRDNDNWDRLMWFANTGYHHKKLNLDFSYSSTEMKTDLDYAAYKDDDNYKLNFRRHLINGNLSWKFNDVFSTHLSSGFTDTKRYAVNDSSVVDAAGTFDHSFLESTYSGRYKTTDLNLNAHFKHADFLAGASANQEDMQQEDYVFAGGAYPFESKTNLDTITPATTTAVYARADLNGALLPESFNKLNLTLGIRYSNHSVCGGEFIYDETFSILTGENSLFYVSFSSGFNNPSLYQLYAPETYTPWDGGTSANLTRGNKNLKAEKSSSGEIGFKQKVTDKIQYTISLFQSETQNLIEYVYLWNKEIEIDTLGNDFGRDDYRGDRYLNIGKQTTAGIELNILSSLNDKLKLEANATLVSGTIEYNPSSSIEQQSNGEHVQLYSTGAFLNSETKTSGLVRRPSEANLKLVFSPNKKFTSTLSVRYVTARNDIYYNGSLGPYGALAVNVVDAYTLLGFAVNWNVQKYVSLNFRGENLTNQKYEEIHGFTTRGRAVYAIVNFKF